MQIYALDANEKLITPHTAQKRTSYQCLECKGVLHLRGGLWKKKHFYHVHRPKECRHLGKSKLHAKIQSALKKMIKDEGPVILEYPFPEIRRIADVAWIKEKIIFEIQCSFISKEEIFKRNQDYAQIGYTVVWILHDRLLNRFSPLEAQIFLKNHPHYFTSMTLFGKEGFYDQYKTKKFKIDLSRPIRNTLSFPSNFPRERKEWPLFFEGDLFTQSYQVIFSKKKRGHFLALLKSFELFVLERISNQ